MKYGYLKVAAATPELRVADCMYNAQQTIRLMKEADALGVRLLVFPELGLTGYTCADLLLQDALQKGALEALADIREASTELKLTAVVGLPFAADGKLYNCAAVVMGGRILGIVPKTHLPNYGELEEVRYFAPPPAKSSVISVLGDSVAFGSDLLFACREWPEYKFGVEICADAWAPISPGTRHAMAGAAVLCCLSAGHEIAGKDARRRRLVTETSARLCCGYVYANAGRGESTTDLVFAGHDLIAERGELLAESALFTEGLTVTELDLQAIAAERRRNNCFPVAVPDDHLVVYFSLGAEEVSLTRPFDRHPFLPKEEEDCRTILRIQAEGLARRMRHIGCSTPVLGISGGLDSTLALIVAAEAMTLLGKELSGIVSVTMPGFGTSDLTRGNAELLCEAMGTTLRTISIDAAVRQHFKDIGHDETVTDTTYENSQARERTQLLMDIANQVNGIVVGTGDLSELALGWATYNGDHMSMYSVNGSIPKTLVRRLVQYAADHCGNESLAKVLQDILDTPVSPELLPTKDGEIVQKTEEVVGPYELHDFFLYHFMREGASPAKLLHMAEHAFEGQYDRAAILKYLRIFLRKFFQQQFKRSCLPDGPKATAVSLSPRGDWQMPSDASAAYWLKQLDELENTL